MTHASLFSGIGGPEVAAEMLGWENAFHCEINPFGKAILEYWFPNSVSYEDITKTDFREWRGKIDVLTGGFPCQPFSYAGKRGGREDERYLWPQMLRAIDEARPTWVVGENVAGLATMVEGGVLSHLGSETTLFGEGDEIHGYLLRETFTIERICRDLERIGYSVQPMLIPAAAVGAPHRRDRIFIIAHVADSDRRDDLRGSGENERERAQEWLQERDSVRKPGESDKVRSASCEDVADSYGERREEPFKPGREEDYSKTRTGMDDRTLRPRTDGASSNTDSGRLEGTSEGRREGAGDDALRSRGDILQEYASNTANIRLSRTTYAGTKGKVRGEMDEERNNAIGGVSTTPASRGRFTSNTDGHRRREMDKHLQSEVANGPEPFSDGWERDASDAICKGLEGKDKSRSREGGERVCLRRNAPGHGWARDGRLLPENRWREFPTVSPVHRGNDGLPFDVDNLTIPFAKWRTESIKAYGNAIVPQVMYEIFRAIEEVSK